MRSIFRLRYIVPLVLLATLVVTAMATGARLFNIQTGSMRPGIGIHSLILTVDANSLKKGDIVTFDSHKLGVVTHRVYEIKPDGTIITKGDYNNTPDTWHLTKSDIYGKKVGPAIPRIGAWLELSFWNWKIHQIQFYGGILLIISGFIIYVMARREQEEGGRHRDGAKNELPELAAKAAL